MDADIGAPECADIEPFKPPNYVTYETPQPAPHQLPDWPNGWKLDDI